MSATMDRVTRRDIRRAVGDEALNVIDRQGQAIEALTLRLHTMEEFAELQRARIAVLEANWSGLRGLK